MAEFDGDATPEALAAWERYRALPVNKGTDLYTPEMCEQDAFTAAWVEATKAVIKAKAEALRDAANSLPFANPTGMEIDRWLRAEATRIEKETEQ